jgi:hypothetical protein
MELNFCHDDVKLFVQVGKVRNGILRRHKLPFDELYGDRLCINHLFDIRKGCHPTVDVFRLPHSRLAVILGSYGSTMKCGGRNEDEIDLALEIQQRALIKE